MNRWLMVMKQSTVLFLLLAVGLSLVLFSVKYKVQDLEQELVDINRNVVAEHQKVRTLQAEFSYLTEAERLRGLSEHYLGHRPVTPEQLGNLGTLLADPPEISGFGFVVGPEPKSPVTATSGRGGN